MNATAARRAELETAIARARAAARVSLINNPRTACELRLEIMDLSGGYYTPENLPDTTPRAALATLYVDTHVEGSPEYAALEMIKAGA